MVHVARGGDYSVLVERIEGHDESSDADYDVGVPYRFARVSYRVGAGWVLVPMSVDDRLFRKLLRTSIVKGVGLNPDRVVNLQEPGKPLLGPVSDRGDFTTRLVPILRDFED